MSSSVGSRTLGAPVAGHSRVALVAVLVLLVGAVAGVAYLGSTQTGSLLSTSLSVPTDGARTAKVDINTGTGNLTIDKLVGDERTLVSGTLQYFESQGVPSRSAGTSSGQATVTLKPGDSKQSWLRLPWASCAGQTDWNIHLNPAVASDVTVHSDGGNLKLDLAGMAVTRLSADTGGGNVDVVLPESGGSLSATASTGGGNVVVHVPSGMAARIHATSGLGAVVVDPRFSQTDRDTYESPDYASAANRVEITAKSGAGNVVVNTK